jgi:two-component system response regulator AlgR
MKIMIVDDEALARDRLRSLIDELGGHEIVAEAANGHKALEALDESGAELVLLDIRMPGMDGMEVARHLLEFNQPPAVIFVTAYDQHALEAFEANAVDYLLKPVRKERLEQALNKAGQLTRAQLEEVQEVQGARSHICARARGRVQLIPVEDIIFFMADQKYVTLLYPEGEVLIEEPLKQLEDEFGDCFIRIHRNALVAADQLQGMEKSSDGGYFALLKDSDKKLEISRRHVPGIRKLLKNQG